MKKDRLKEYANSRLKEEDTGTEIETDVKDWTVFFLNGIEHQIKQEHPNQSDAFYRKQMRTIFDEAHKIVFGEGRRTDKYPHPWMLDDKQIKAVLREQ